MPLKPLSQANARLHPFHHHSLSRDKDGDKEDGDEEDRDEEDGDEEDGNEEDGNEEDVSRCLEQGAK